MQQHLAMMLAQAHALPKLWPMAITSKHLSTWHLGVFFYQGLHPFDDAIVFCRKYYGLIIGRGGESIFLIQSETNTKIQIPRKEQQSSIINIFGRNRENVCAARDKIESIVSSAQHKHSSSRSTFSPSHFNNVWISDDGIKSNYERFMVSCRIVNLQ